MFKKIKKSMTLKILEKYLDIMWDLVGRGKEIQDAEESFSAKWQATV